MNILDSLKRYERITGDNLQILLLAPFTLFKFFSCKNLPGNEENLIVADFSLFSY
jgi:hypothetical protein